MKFTIVTFLIFIAARVFAQPELDIKPNRIEFEDLFNRVDYAFLINKGDQTLTIDSIDYDESNYIISYENNLQIPFTIAPDDSIKMTVLLSSFYEITINDTTDTMYVYNDGIESPEPLEIRIRFFEDDFGEINGTVRDSLNLADSATVYFLYNGVYLIDTAMTNSLGYYAKTLPEGTYTIGVEKEGYYVVFHDSTYDPFFAEFMEIDSGTIRTIDFNLKSIDDPNLSISGQISDSISGIQINRGIVIIRNGTHVPIGKPSVNPLLLDTLYTLAGFIKADGSFKVYTQIPDHYYLQAYSNYFLPGFFNDEGNASVYWQNADSILIDHNIIDKNITLVTDSSYGNGSVGGFINFTTPVDESYFDGIIILAKNISNGALYSYNFGKEFGDYKVTNIPYGTYELVAQKIGIDNAVSQTVTIDPINNQLTGINLNFTITEVKDDAIFPDDIILYQNFPNPFNPVTNISFYLQNPSRIKLKVLNILGETLQTLIDGDMNSGNHSLIFDGKNLASGVYLIILEGNRTTFSEKIMLLK